MTSANPLPETVRAKDLMHKQVIAVDKDLHLEEVIKLMQRHRVSKVPVVEHGRLVGVATDGAIVDKLGSLHNRSVGTNTLHASSVAVRDVRPASPDDPWRHVLLLLDGDKVGLVPVVHDNLLLGVITKADFLPYVLLDTPVKDIGVRQLHSVAPHDRVVHARRLMLDHGIERMPVLDGGRVAGIISEMDIAIALDTMKKRVDQHHQARHLAELQVRDVMSSPVVTCPPDTTAREAARMMKDKDVGCLPIVNGQGTIQGMVTRSDLIRRLVGDDGRR